MTDKPRTPSSRRRYSIGEPGKLKGGFSQSARMGSLAPKERVFASLSNIANLKSAADAAMENFDDEFNHHRSGCSGLMARAGGGPRRAARGERAACGERRAGRQARGERHTGGRAASGQRHAGKCAASGGRPSCFEWLRAVRWRMEGGDGGASYVVTCRIHTNCGYHTNMQ